MTTSTSPQPSWFHLVAGVEPAVFLTRGSMLFDIDPSLKDGLEREQPWALDELQSLGGESTAMPNVAAPIAALSLNVAQTCNLACSYCYADEGRFGGRARTMEAAVAFAAIDRLIEQARDRITVGFIGGEPFVNRQLMHDAVEYAKAGAKRAGLRITFSVTTNATLLSEEDLQFLRDEAFTITVSLDGGPLQNKHRIDRKDVNSIWAVLAGIRPLLDSPGPTRIVARATVTRDDLDVTDRVEWLSQAGFAEVGVSPVRTGPEASLRFSDSDWAPFLEQMIAAARLELDRVLAGATPRFSNLWTMLDAIYRGSARPLPCGSVANYLSVDVDGSFASCHRTVGNAMFHMGSTTTGFDADKRRRFIELRVVDRQEPCRTCWARYLCGGGCHAEVTEVGRAGCDYIRGWLDFGLQAYRHVMTYRPEVLARSET
ncbi:radical SAM/SPASM domain-containing protein [Paraburkholderia silvatlantica]|uniref:Radical SAM core domain-containing protein n=1 Tax=Paraburkholderia silvatlantica TaxID=321895 RepID=A0ABR6FYA1_9BURK|nr:radical SAM protein [Paraburkholderia silvatlantica]MBB2932053.1 uncharacterized protein [Paraburkholderia silvatlantica]PVY24728.1 uncharacterized protein C7411_127117 [Paraburkholderia silvatlantica]PXW31224.1 uncharacterized protein C7413_126117 [Paraburkholderia silvatlantica]